MSRQTHYEVLGLPPSASVQSIRQSYRQLALQWHPDKNPLNRAAAEEKFKRISEAYEVLSDPSRRAAYDRGGSRAPLPSMNHFSMFEEMFGPQGPFGSSMGFDDHHDFFGGPRMMDFGGGGFMSSFSSSMSSFSSGGGRSVSKEIVSVNGRRVTRTVTRVTNPDGTVTEDVEEQVEEARAPPPQSRHQVEGTSSSRRRVHY